MTDFTMYPMIRPGALLKIDTNQNKLSTAAWRNEYERPMFFIELRGAYACGWCELQGNQLLIIPHSEEAAANVNKRLMMGWTNYANRQVRRILVALATSQALLSSALQ